jgi:hypothetical protein
VNNEPQVRCEFSFYHYKAYGEKMENARMGVRNAGECGQLVSFGGYTYFFSAQA